MGRFAQGAVNGRLRGYCAIIARWVDGGETRDGQVKGQGDEVKRPDYLEECPDIRLGDWLTGSGRRGGENFFWSFFARGAPATAGDAIGFRREGRYRAGLSARRRGAVRSTIAGR